jgi:hypothetical protein
MAAEPCCARAGADNYSWLNCQCVRPAHWLIQKALYSVYCPEYFTNLTYHKHQMCPAWLLYWPLASRKGGLSTGSEAAGSKLPEAEEAQMKRCAACLAMI